MEYIKVTELKEILKDVSLSNNDLGKHGDGFEQAMQLINKRLESINYTRCCETFKKEQHRPSPDIEKWMIEHGYKICD